MYELLFVTAAANALRRGSHGRRREPIAVLGVATLSGVRCRRAAERT
jgi:hypothetical protein